MERKPSTDAECSTFVELLRWRALNQSDQKAYAFLTSEEEEKSLTYAQLDRQARAIGAMLQKRGAAAERVLLLYPSGLEYIAAFFGCLYAGALAVPAYPPHSNRSLERLSSIAADAQARFVLTTSPVLSKIACGKGQAPSLHVPDLQWIATDRENSEQDETNWQMPKLTGSTIAFLQYTSGSTATPKGVMVSHSNLLSDLKMLQAIAPHPAGIAFVSWLPLFHDMGLIGHVLQALYMASPCILLPPSVFVQSPFRWLKAVSLYQAYTSAAPNFAYELCVEKVTPEQRDALDLSGWKVAICGAEPVRAQTLTNFAEYFQPCGFGSEALRAGYGLAEATVFVSLHREQTPLAHRLNKDALEQHQVVLWDTATTEREHSSTVCVNCGRTELDARVVIVNPETCVLCPPGSVGEIWLAGSHVAQGYWNHPEETERTFRAYIRDTGEGPFLRTGDLGFLLDGDLFVTGRLKDVIIIQGRNHYPQDIEQTVQRCHAALRPQCGAAFSIEGEERVVLVQEIEREYRQAEERDQICRAIRQAIAEEHDIDVQSVVLIRHGSLPKTSSGKIQRRACRSRFLDGTLNVVYQWMRDANRQTLQHGGAETCPTIGINRTITINRTATEELLISIWKEVLDLSEVGLNDNFFELGGDSLLATQVVVRASQALQVDLPLRSLFEAPTIAQLSRALESFIQQAPSLPAAMGLPIEHPADLPLSFAQEGLWFLHQWDPDGASSNISLALRLCGPLQVAALELSLATVVRRHEVLRTTFSSGQGQPVQVIAPLRQDPCPGRWQTGYRITVTDLRSCPIAERDQHVRQLARADAHRPFDLMHGPLWRMSLLRLDEQEHALLFTLHHIICDGWSMGIVMREISSIYQTHMNGEPDQRPELPIQYVDYALWQRQWLQGEVLEGQLAYWRKQLAEAPALLSLPTDRPRPAVQTFAGARLSQLLPPDLHQQLKSLSQREHVTLFMTGLAAFQVLLMRYSGQLDLVVGTPIAHRTRKELEGLIGFFVNMLLLRTDLSGHPTFQQVLCRVKKVAMQAYAYQDLPFVKLVEDLQPERHPSYQPLCQVVFILQNFPTSMLALPGVTCCPMEVEKATSQFDLSLFLSEEESGLLTTLEYNTDLFDEATMRRLLGHWQVLLEAIVRDPGQAIETLPLLTEGEREQILAQGIESAECEYPLDQCIHQLVELQVARTPDAVALVFEDEVLTYQTLNRRANQLAAYLQALGVGPEVLVGLCLQRSSEMLVGLLGVLKAGGAYVPLDPTLPTERLAFLIEDAQVRIILTHDLPDGREVPLARGVRAIHLVADWPVIATGEQENPQTTLVCLNPVYLIYTSGSTGKPKGVLNTHQGLCNRLHWMQQAYQLTPQDRVLQKTPLSFDVSFWECFWPLLTGASVIIARPASHQDPAYLRTLMIRQQVTTLHFVPSMLQSFLWDEPQGSKYLQSFRSLRQVFCSGEALSVELQARFFAQMGEEVALHNLYGPTEAAIDVTFWRCQRGSGASQQPESSVPIGRPIANTQIYLLDQDLAPVPIGVTGELYIGGVGLARGYAKRPELTAERFVPHPWSQGLGTRLYRTGDLARYRHDGEIEYLGRLDQQVKIRGFRIELGEIEAHLMRHPMVCEVVVVAREDTPDKKHLVAYVVAHTGEIPQTEASFVAILRQYCREQLPDAMVPAFFVQLPALPLSLNGKVDRRALPVPERSPFETSYGQIARTPVEEVVSAIYREVLGVEQFGLDESFFDLGGHSLLAIQVISRIRAAIGIELSVRDLFETPSVAGLAKQIEQQLRSGNQRAIPPLVAMAREQDLPLSFAQQRLWFQEQMVSDHSTYVLPLALRLRGSLQVSVLEQCLREIIRRHESLRTTFAASSGQPLQMIHADAHVSLIVIDLPIGDAEKQLELFCQQPFDVSQGPLMRMALLRLQKQEHLFCIVVHHIIFDAWSTSIFFRELSLLYEAILVGKPSPLPPLPLQYADVALWQRDWLQGAVLDALLRYWTKQLARAVPVQMPTDRPRSALLSDRGAIHTFTLPPHLCQQLRTLSREVGVTLFMTLLSAFQLLLSRTIGQDDIVVGTDSANRTELTTENIIGFFVNILALRVKIQAQATFRETVKSVCTTVLAAYVHQELPFEKLVDALRLKRDPSQVPLINVLFVLNNVPQATLDLPGLTVSTVESKIHTTKFDVALFLMESDQMMSGYVNYRTDLFDAKTIVSLVRHFEVLLHSIVTAPDSPVETLEMFTKQEREQAIEEERVLQEMNNHTLKVARRRIMDLTSKS